LRTLYETVIETSDVVTSRTDCTKVNPLKRCHTNHKKG